MKFSELISGLMETKNNNEYEQLIAEYFEILDKKDIKK